MAKVKDSKSVNSEKQVKSGVPPSKVVKKPGMYTNKKKGAK